MIDKSFDMEQKKLDRQVYEMALPFLPEKTNWSIEGIKS